MEINYILLNAMIVVFLFGSGPSKELMAKLYPFSLILPLFILLSFFGGTNSPVLFPFVHGCHLLLYFSLQYTLLSGSRAEFDCHIMSPLCFSLKELKI